MTSILCRLYSVPHHHTPPTPSFYSRSSCSPPQAVLACDNVNHHMVGSIAARFGMNMSWAKSKYWSFQECSREVIFYMWLPHNFCEYTVRNNHS